MSDIYQPPQDGSDVITSIDIAMGRGRGISDVHIYGTDIQTWNEEENDGDGPVETLDKIKAAVRTDQILEFGPPSPLPYWVDIDCMAKPQGDPDYWPGIPDWISDTNPIGDALRWSGITKEKLKQNPHTFILKTEYTKFIQAGYANKFTIPMNSIQGPGYIAAPYIVPALWPGWSTMGYRRSALSTSNKRFSTWMFVIDGNIVTGQFRIDEERLELSGLDIPRQIFYGYILPAITNKDRIQVWGAHIDSQDQAPYEWNFKRNPSGRMFDMQYCQAAICLGFWDTDLMGYTQENNFDEAYGLYPYEQNRMYNNQTAKNFRYNSTSYANGWCLPYIDGIFGMLQQYEMESTDLAKGGGSFKWWLPYPFESLEAALNYWGCSNPNKDPLSWLNMFCMLAKGINASQIAIPD